MQPQFLVRLWRCPLLPRERRSVDHDQIDPPQTQDRLEAIEALLSQEQEEAHAGARVWRSRLVAEAHVTHILVVSDSPAQDLEVNRRVEEAMRAMNMGLSVTTPMPVVDSSTS